MSETRTIVVGGGAFGFAAALELRRRGHAVVLVEAGEIPYEHASSTDISKMVRMDYGADGFYAELAERALARWDVWNTEAPRPLYHQDGFLLLAGDPMRPGGFEHDSYELLVGRGHPLERLDAAGLSARFPAWSGERYPEGYFNPRAGWAESGATVVWMAERARAAGIDVRPETPLSRLLSSGSRVTGIETAAGDLLEADRVILATGAWTLKLLPELDGLMWETAQTVLHFRPADPAEFRPPRFAPWGADIANTGWYGFPATDDGIVKVANHGAGWRLDPDAPRRIDPGEEERFREFFRECLPALLDAPLSHGRICLYCDTWDGNFWIDRHPDRPGLFVAAGGSGHGFKFAPVLGEIVADLVEDRPNRWLERFRWRQREGSRTEHARHME
jgi:glycine/D-amino acid oxidase-like deaminating enzyme